VLKTLLGQLPNLRAIEDVGPDQALLVVQQLKERLEKLSLAAAFDYPAAISNALIAHCPNLEHLGLWGNLPQFEQVVQACPKLRSLHFNGPIWSGDYMNSGLRLIAQRGLLERIHMRNVYGMGEGLQEILAHCPLTHVALNYCSVPESILRGAVARNQSRLISFDCNLYWHLPRMADDRFTLLAQCPNLREVRLDGWILGIPAIQEFLEKSKHLQIVRIRGPISDDILFDLVSACPTLRCLEICEHLSSRDPRVTYQGIRKILTRDSQIETIVIPAGEYRVLREEERDALKRDFPEVEILDTDPYKFSRFRE
jgi:hypothetical protein